MKYWFHTQTQMAAVSSKGAAWLILIFLGLVLGGATAFAARPEPTNWFSGDIHVHRSCGGAPVSISTISNAMLTTDISVVSLLADMGNGEVLDPTTDLPKVTGADSSSSPPNRIIRWDAEWHWDATYTQYVHQALGGHIVALGLTNAAQLWKESTYPVFDWAHQQGAVAGFAHFQYLPDDSFPTTLDCCLPLEYPVEVALGACDFISQDVTGANAAMLAYYRLLNCGFRPGFAGGSDYPCGAQIGDVTTFVEVDGALTYRKWIDGLRDGRTVVCRNGRREFLNLTANTNATPGDEISLPAGGGTVQVSVTWSSSGNASGLLELVKNGVVITNKSASINANSTSILSASITFTNSGWLVARRMNGSDHRVHTAAIFVKVDNQPVRASLTDAQFYVNWMDQLILRTRPGAAWGKYFTGTNSAAVRARYEAARAVYAQIANEAAAALAPKITTTNLPNGAVNSPYAQPISAWRGLKPYHWSVSAGALPAGLSFNADTGILSGTPVTNGTSNFTVQLVDSSTPPNSVTQALALTVLSSFPAMTLWPTSSAPAVAADTDASSTTVGFKFLSLTRGQVKGIRFYKGSGNTGTHTGQLWTSNGTLLASITFSNETSTGWQQALFSTPITIASNTVYVASYHAPVGRYAKTEDYFLGKGVTNHPLIALQDTAASANGLYRYATSMFPTNTYLSTHYWVDVVFQPNNAPVLSVQTNRTVPELSLMIVTNTASDSDLPANALSYQLLNPPSNAVINASGVITWTPSEAQGPGTNQLASVVSDGMASATNSFQVIVTEVNLPPGFLAPPTNRTVPELTLLTVTNTATDGDVPAQTLSYQLLNPPSNAEINASGVITWTPSEAQGPGTNQLTSVVSDGVEGTTNVTTVIVLEVNSAPAFSGTPTNVSIPDHGSLQVANPAADDDVPANVLTYTLLNSPTNAAVSSNGVITWAPGTNQAPSTNVFTTVVSDGGASVTNNFVVTVLAPLVAPTIVSIEVTNGDAIVTWTSAMGQSYILEYLDDATATNWASILPGTIAAGTNTSATNATLGAPVRIYRVRSPELFP